MNERLPIRDRTLILRILVPGLEARLRDKMKETEDAAAAPMGGASSSSSDSYLDVEGVSCEPTAARNRTLWTFHCDGASYPAKLVNLPCPVELHKTHDHVAYYKSVDIAQMLIVYEDDIALEEAEEKPIEGFPNYYHSGLTPPMKRVVERRFAAREHKAQPPPRAAVSDVEGELMTLMEKLAKNNGQQSHSQQQDSTKRNRVPVLTSANKVLVEESEEVVDYEPWHDDYGRQPAGVEFDADDAMSHQHPEIWLPPEDIREIRERELEAKRKKQALKKEKKLKNATKKKGIASKKNMEPMDDVMQAAQMVHAADNVDNFDLDDILKLDLDQDDILENGDILENMGLDWTE